MFPFSNTGILILRLPFLSPDLFFSSFLHTSIESIGAEGHLMYSICGNWLQCFSDRGELVLALIYFPFFLRLSDFIHLLSFLFVLHICIFIFIFISILAQRF